MSLNFKPARFLSIKSCQHGGAERTLYVLITLAQYGKPISVNQLAELTSLAISTLYRQLALLKNWGFVQEVNASYMLGPACLQLALGFEQSSWLQQEALPEMQDLSSKSNETVGLMVVTHGQMVCIEMVESSHALRCSFVKGKGLPLLQGASAQSLLAFLPPKTSLEIIEQSNLTLDEQNHLKHKISQIRQQGYALSSNEIDSGIWGVSVPLRLNDNILIGTITLMAPNLRILGREDSLLNLTKQCAARIIRRLNSL